MRISDWSSDVCSSDLEIGTPARKRNEGGQGDSVAARGQYVGKQRTAEQRPSHFRYLLFRQSRPADREPRFLQRLAQRGDARRSIGFVDPKPIEARDAIIVGVDAPPPGTPPAPARTPFSPAH